MKTVNEHEVHERSNPPPFNLQHQETLTTS